MTIGVCKDYNKEEVKTSSVPNVTTACYYQLVNSIQYFILIINFNTLDFVYTSHW